MPGVENTELFSRKRWPYFFSKSRAINELKKELEFTKRELEETKRTAEYFENASRQVKGFLELTQGAIHVNVHYAQESDGAIKNWYTSLMGRMDTWSLQFDRQAACENPADINVSDVLLELFRKVSPRDADDMVSFLNNCGKRELQSYAKALSTQCLCDTVFEPVKKMPPETLDCVTMKDQFAELEASIFSYGRFLFLFFINNFVEFLFSSAVHPCHKASPPDGVDSC